MESVGSATVLKQSATGGERVVILDAGAQYGKVQTHSYNLKLLGSLECKNFAVQSCHIFVTTICMHAQS